MSTKRIIRILLKTTGIITGIIALLLLAFHIWLNWYAKDMVEDLVRRNSDGRISLDIKKLTYNYFSRKLTVTEAVLANNDTASAPMAYHIRLPRMSVRLKGIWPLIRDKKLLIDTLSLQAPEFRVTQLRENPDSPLNRQPLSLSREMGNIYQSIQGALQQLQVTRFGMEEARFTLDSRMQPGQAPLVISHIYLRLDHLQVREEEEADTDKPYLSENMILRIRNQDITLPNQRHRISFRQFRINVRKKRMEFDSCTIQSVASGNEAIRFRLFFDELALTNIQFPALYRENRILADSMLCTNPEFFLHANLDQTVNAQEKGMSLDDILRNFSGDIGIRRVAVNNAGIDIHTLRNGIPNSFSSRRNSFAMDGFSMNQAEKDPIRVEEFSMAIRDYKNFIKDSTYTITFDSILFRNSRVILSNFLFQKVLKGKIINTFRMPYFSLHGLSWDDLVFEKRIRAQRVGMIQPDIRYTYNRLKQARAKGRDLFDILGSLNEFMELDQLEIENGNLDLQPGPDLHIRLEGANLSVSTQALLSAREITGLRDAARNISISRGTIRQGNSEIQLSDLHYENEGDNLQAGFLGYSSRDSAVQLSMIRLTLTGVAQWKKTGEWQAQYLRWDSATIRVRKSGIGQGKIPPGIRLDRLYGGPSLLRFEKDDLYAFSRLERVRADSFRIEEGGTVRFHFLSFAGNNLEMRAGGINLSSGLYQVEQGSPSVLQDVNFSMEKPGIQLHIKAPSLQFTGELNKCLEGLYRFSEIGLANPDILLKQTATTTREPVTSRPRQLILEAGKLWLDNPALSARFGGSKGEILIDWNQEKRRQGEQLNVSGFRLADSGRLTAGFNEASFHSNNVQARIEGKKMVETGKRAVDAVFGPTAFSKGNGEAAAWSGEIKSLSAPSWQLDSLLLGKGQTLSLEQIRIRDLLLGKELINNPAELTAQNKRFSLQIGNGLYQNPETNAHFSNLLYRRSDDVFQLDSFRLRPGLVIDSFMATRPYQQDYLDVEGKKVKIQPVALEHYLRTGELRIYKAELDSVLLLDYKDKRLPPKPGRIRHLPVNLIRRVRIPVFIDSILFTNGRVDYSEVNEKTGITGNVTVNRMMLQLINLRNRDYRPGDSLFIRANGYILDTVWTRLRVKQSYSDSLGGFKMTLRMKPGDLRVLNPTLIPLAGVKLNSGDLDTLSMRVTGREYLSYGEMKMFYRNLRLRLLPTGTDSRQPFRTRLTSALANAFVIKSSNKSRIGPVFFIRDRNKSVINYLFRITTSGIASSVGISRPKKLARKFREEIEKRKLPGMDW